MRNHHPKRKSIAVLLSIFVGIWTWIYTYEKDSWKFWTHFSLIIITVGLWVVASWVWAVVDTARKPASYFESFSK